MTEERKYAILFAATLLCAETEPVGLGQAEPGESGCGRDDEIAVEQRISGC
jgi:hypothetical protein